MAIVPVKFVNNTLIAYFFEYVISLNTVIFNLLVAGHSYEYHHFLVIRVRVQVHLHKHVLRTSNESNI